MLTSIQRIGSLRRSRPLCAVRTRRSIPFGFVSLIVDVETALNVDHGLNISLADDSATSGAQSPFATVETLREYILTLAAGQ